jgi:hypothetical protein
MLTEDAILNILIRKNREELNRANELVIHLENVCQFAYSHVFGPGNLMFVWEIHPVGNNVHFKHVPDWHFCLKISLNARVKQCILVVYDTRFKRS